jgi:hypothetical protein
VQLDTETLWRLATRTVEPAQALARARARGEGRLAEAACQVVSVIH